MNFTNDAEFFAAVRRELYTAAVGDILDSMGHRTHFLPPQIHPLAPGMVVVGRAAPVVVRDEAGDADDCFGRLLDALDALKAGDVYLTDGGATHYALWGELMSTRALHLGATGAVMNGYCRDANGILELGFPTFCWGSYALDIKYRGKVVDYGVPSMVGGIRVEPGDVVFGDRDGVLVVPQALAAEAFEAAFTKVRTENQVREAFRQGMPAVEAYAKFGVM